MKYYDLLMMLRRNELWNLMVPLIVEEGLESYMIASPSYSDANEQW